MPLRSRPILALAVALLVAGAGLVPPTLGRYVDAAIGAGSATTDTLEPPTGLVAIGGISAALIWVPTADAYASGYQVERATSPLGPFAPVSTVTPSVTIGFTDLPGAGTFYYRVRTFYATWTSAYTATVVAIVTATGWHGCATQAADGSGDGDGFEVTPGNACLPGAPAAVDVDSGSNNITNDCTDAGKDRHRFWDFSLGIPAAVTSINGIEVRLNHSVSDTTGVNRMCVRLSWNGGASWTATQQVNILSTSVVTAILGGPVDTWGRAWSGAELSNGNLRVQVIDATNKTGKDFTLEDIAVNVYYTP